MWVIHTGGLRADVGLITQHDIESDTVSDECCGGTKKINTFHSDTRFPWWNIIHPIGGECVYHVYNGLLSSGTAGLYTDTLRGTRRKDAKNREPCVICAK